ncbi:MAG: protein phosphatase 2C domain-containing protein [Thermoguttaceae bacterium]|jgi:hypothetical protein
MAAKSHAYCVPRRGSSRAEYEDAVAVDEAAGRYALADGATESSFAQSWAQLLVEGFVACGRDAGERWPAPLGQLQRRWREAVPSGPVPWFAEAKLAEGAFAAFLGVILAGGTAAEPHRWQAAAVGDVCLFHVRDGRLLSAFPIQRAADFHSAPRLLGSRDGEQYWQQQALYRQGRALTGDRLWMMTDALAHWFLAEHEAGQTPAVEICAALGDRAGENGGEESFAAWIEQLRNAHRIANDDVTWLALEVLGKDD